MKILKLDLKKWRCGGYCEYQLGTGRTQLLNDSGFMCCLGQFSAQLGVPKENLLGVSRPGRLKNPPSEFVNGSNNSNNSGLALKAMEINDDEDLTTEERISQLKELFKEHGFEIEVIE